MAGHDDSDSEDEQQFVVEVIKAARVHKGRWEYRVKWANYDSSDDTWEPAKNLTNCKRLLKSFWEDVGMDDEDYYEGYEVMATPTWIKREKAHFLKSLNKRETEEDESEDDATGPSSFVAKIGEPSVKKEKTTKKRGRPPKIKPKPEPGGAYDSDNATLSATRKKGKKRAKALVSSSEDEDDDKPLSSVVKPTRPTIKIPAQRKKPSPSPDSGSAGSLFSDKDQVSSPEVALGSASGTQTANKPPNIPMKRPSGDNVGSGQRKRQVMEMPMPITGTAGNATKARLAQRIPQPVSQSTASTSTKLALSQLKFKKNSATTSAISPVQTNSPTNVAPAIPPLPRRSGSTSSHGQSPAPPAQDSPMLESYTPVAVAQPSQSTEQRRVTLPLPRRNVVRQQLQSPVTDPMAAADKFLSQVMPAEMASSMQEEAVSDMPPPPVPARATQVKPGALPRIPKKWKWTGELFMDVSRNRAERLCEVTLSKPSEPLPNGLRFSICLTSDSIRLSAFQSLASLPLFLLASTRPQQFTKIGPMEDKDADAVKQLGTYMRNKSLFCFAHLYMDDTSVALLIVYPTDHPIANKVLQVPITLAKDTHLQAALVPWELTSKEFGSTNWKQRVPTIETALDPKLVPVLDARGREVVTKRRFHQALHILRIPRAVFDYVSLISRPYCIWTGPTDTTSTSASYETSLLKEVLSTCKGKDMGHKADVRVIFVHVGGLATLHLLPALAERRMKTAVRFLTYGTHPSVPRERWGVREIYPLGGVVTFTPGAIIEGHLRLFSRIKQIAEHPTWECYVLPSVVAMVAKLTCQGQHPLRVYDDGNFVYEELLKLIEQGTVALLQAPQVGRDSLSKGDPSLVWTRWTLRLPAMNARQILEECLSVAADTFANTSEADLPRAIEKEIARDLWRMQNQPAIMDDHRRFVVIHTRADANLPKEAKGFECTTLSNFDFRDDFYADKKQ